MGTNDSFEKLVRNYNKAVATLREELRTGMLAVIRNTFDENPTLESVSWTQYTDYFNDGEPCNFYVHGDAVDVVVDGVEAEVSSYRVDRMEATNPRIRAYCAALEITGAIMSVPDVALDAFGDHVLVTLSRTNGEVNIEVADYTDHD